MRNFSLVLVYLLVVGRSSIAAAPVEEIEKEIGELLNWEHLYVELRPYVTQDSRRSVPATIGRSGTFFGFCSRALNLCTVYRRYSYRNPEAQKSTECCGAAGEKDALLALMRSGSATTVVHSTEPSTIFGGLSSIAGLTGQPTSLPSGANPPVRPDVASRETPQLFESNIPLEPTLPSPATYKSSASADDVASLQRWTQATLGNGLYRRAIVPCVKRSDPFAYVLFYPRDSVNGSSLVVGLFYDFQSGQWTTAELIRTPPANRTTARLELLFKEGGCGVIYPQDLSKPQ
jgi:hypothetical protein